MFKKEVHTKYTNLAQKVVPQWLFRNQETGLSCHYSLLPANIDVFPPRPHIRTVHLDVIKVLFIHQLMHQ
jgi:hypothetical protein